MANLQNVDRDPEAVASPGKPNLGVGEYKVVIIGDELKESNDGKAKMLVTRLQICEGNFAGEVVDFRITLSHTDQSSNCQKAVQIGNGNFNKICEICNVDSKTLTDTTALYGVPFIMRTKPDEFIGQKGEKVPWYKIAGIKAIKAAAAKPESKAPGSNQW